MNKHTRTVTVDVGVHLRFTATDDRVLDATMLPPDFGFCMEVGDATTTHLLNLGHRHQHQHQHPCAHTIAHITSARLGHCLTGPGNRQGSTGPVRVVAGFASAHERVAVGIRDGGPGVGRAGARGGGHADDSRSDVAVHEQHHTRGAAVVDYHDAPGPG